MTAPHPFVITPGCRVCRLAKTDPEARAIVDDWLMGRAHHPELHPAMTLGREGTGSEVATFLANRTERAWRRQDPPQHKKHCLLLSEQVLRNRTDEGPEGTRAEVLPRRGEESVRRPVKLPSAPSIEPLLEGAPAADERYLDAYLADVMGIVRNIRFASAKRSRTEEGREMPIVTAPESQFVLGVGANIERLLALRPGVRASSMAGGTLPVRGLPGSFPGGPLGDGGRAEGLRALLARATKAAAEDPPTIPGDEDDGELAYGRGEKILDEEARREAELAEREAEEERVREVESAQPEPSPPVPSDPPIPPVVALQPVSSEEPPASPPPASAPHLRVVVGGAAPAGHDAAWAWKPPGTKGG